MNLPIMTTRPALALAEEHEFERRRLYSLLPHFPAEACATGNVEAEDNLRGIMSHVTFAIFSYSCWLRRVLGRMSPDDEKAQKADFLDQVQRITTASGFTDAAEWASRHYYDTLADLMPGDLDREFKTNWGETMSVETMLEHALVHQMRHRRQLEVMLGRRARGLTRDELADAMMRPNAGSA